MGGGIIALVFTCSALFGPARFRGPAGEWGIRAVTPAPRVGGKSLAKEFFRTLEEEALPLQPGPVTVEAVLSGGPSRRAEEEALSGLEEEFRRRGFEAWRSGEWDGERSKGLVLWFFAGPERKGALSLSLTAPALGVGPIRVRVERASWVLEECLPPGVFRVSGGWEGSPEEALAAARARAEERAESLLARLLPWRPWKRAFLGKFPYETMEKASFLQMRTTPEGKVWKGWVLWRNGPGVLGEAGRTLAREDRLWLFRIGLALVAALASWYGALQLDWATKGFFTFRIRALSFLLWAGACGVLWVVV